MPPQAPRSQRTVAREERSLIRDPPCRKTPPPPPPNIANAPNRRYAPAAIQAARNQFPLDKQSILVRADWDPEAELFVATSDDVPGLVAEAPTPKTLLAKLDLLIPELLALNAIARSQSGWT